MNTDDQAVWWVRVGFTVMLTLGIVKVMDIWEWWATRAERRRAAMVQRLVQPYEVHIWSGEDHRDVEATSDEAQCNIDAINDERVWQDCPQAAGNLEWMRQRFPDETYRAVKIEPR